MSDEILTVTVRTGVGPYGLYEIAADGSVTFSRVESLLPCPKCGGMDGVCVLTICGGCGTRMNP